VWLITDRSSLDLAAIFQSFTIDLGGSPSTSSQSRRNLAGAARMSGVGIYGPGDGPSQDAADFSLLIAPRFSPVSNHTADVGVCAAWSVWRPGRSVSLKSSGTDPLRGSRIDETRSIPTPYVMCERPAPGEGPYRLAGEPSLCGLRSRPGSTLRANVCRTSSTKSPHPSRWASQCPPPAASPSRILRLAFQLNPTMTCLHSQ